MTQLDAFSFDLGRPSLRGQTGNTSLVLPDSRDLSLDMGSAGRKVLLSRTKEVKQPPVTEQQLEINFDTTIANSGLKIINTEVSKTVLRRIFWEMGYNPTQHQVFEAHFYSTFGWQVDMRNIQNSKFPSLKKQLPVFKKVAFLKWLKENVHKLDSLASDNKEQAFRNKNSNVNALQSSNAERSRSAKPGDTRMPDISTRTKNYCELLDVLNRERRVKINVARPIVNKMIVSEQLEGKRTPIDQRRGSPAQVNAPSAGTTSIDERVNQLADRVFFHGLKKGDEDMMRLFRYNQQINEKIRLCFDDLRGETRENKKILLDVVTKQRVEKMRQNEELGKQAQMMARDRLRLAKQNLELKQLEEVVTIMREQDSALDAQRIFQMLHKDDQDMKEKVKLQGKRLLTPQMERKVNSLLRK